jgi:hypothetical protein
VVRVDTHRRVGKGCEAENRPGEDWTVGLGRGGLLRTGAAWVGPISRGGMRGPDEARVGLSAGNGPSRGGAGKASRVVRVRYGKRRFGLSGWGDRSW